MTSASARVLLIASVTALLAFGAGTGTAAAGPAALHVVTFAAPPDADQLDALRAVATGVHGYQHLPAAVAVLSPTVVPLVRNLPGVRGVWANERYQLLDMGSNRTIGADTAWGSYSGGLGHTGTGATGAGVGIGVIDAGVDGTHPDLCGAPEFCRGTPVKTVQNVKFVGDTDRADPVVPVEGVVSTDNTSGHGSHVAGIAAGYGTASSQPGRYQGVAPGAHLVGLGTGEAVEVVNVLAGFDYALAHRAQYNIRVLNNSWGPGAGTPYDPDHPVNLSIDAAWNAGISVVFGAGNDGPRTDSLNAFSVNPHAISAAATRKDGHEAFFSSRGVPGSRLWHPTVAAPGENIVSVRSLTGATTHAGDATSANPEPMPAEDTPYYGNVSGTSMASPHVAGVVALMQHASYATRGAYLTPQQVKDVLQGTARSALPDYQQYTQGAGLVDAAAAVAAARTATAPAYDDGVAYDVRPFRGAVPFSSTVAVTPGAVSLDVMVDWTLLADDVDITLYDPSGAAVGSTFLRCDPARQPNGYSSFCSSAPNERHTVAAPAAGVWRVAAGALVPTAAAVRGLWSVAYPDGTVAVPAPAAPAALTLTAERSVSVQGHGVLLTAAVVDAAGNALPNVARAWSSAGAGAVRSAEAWTAADGQAVATALSDAPGTQTVTVTAGGLTSAVAISWLGVELPVPGTDTPGRVSGGGWYLAGGVKRHFGISASYAAGAAAPGGSIRYDDRTGTAVASDVVERFRISGNTAVLSGPATVNGATGYRYEITVADNGEPGRSDTFRIVLTNPAAPLWSYTSEGTLGGGNIHMTAA